MEERDTRARREAEWVSHAECVHVCTPFKSHIGSWNVRYCICDIQVHLGDSKNTQKQ